MESEVNYNLRNSEKEMFIVLQIRLYKTQPFRVERGRRKDFLIEIVRSETGRINKSQSGAKGEKSIQKEQHVGSMFLCICEELKLGR